MELLGLGDDGRGSNSYWRIVHRQRRQPIGSPGAVSLSLAAAPIVSAMRTPQLSRSIWGPNRSRR